jgi:hypothetical protein
LRVRVEWREFEIPEHIPEKLMDFSDKNIRQNNEITERVRLMGLRKRSNQKRGKLAANRRSATAASYPTIICYILEFRIYSVSGHPASPPWIPTLARAAQRSRPPVNLGA